MGEEESITYAELLEIISIAFGHGIVEEDYNSMDQ
jgi:hypothetical protein